MITFHVERWSEALPELRPLMDLLWDDVAVDKDRFKAKCDESKYAVLEGAGAIHLTTMRSQGKLVGYYVALILPNPHYLGQGLMVYTDMYFVLPEFRKGNFGIRFFKFTEDSWRERGAVKAYTSHKLHRDRSKMFQILGWKASDLVYSKIL